MGKTIDLTGQKFGRLTVVKRVENHVSKCGRRQTKWLCQCDCGNLCEGETIALRHGDKKSCGCLKSEKSSFDSYITPHKIVQTSNKLYHAAFAIDVIIISQDGKHTRPRRCKDTPFAQGQSGRTPDRFRHPQFSAFYPHMPEAYLKTHLSTQQGALCRKALPGHSRCMFLIHRQQPVTLHLEWHGGR